jgi:uncharacterized protein involved in tolerance to divalent cations
MGYLQMSFVRALISATSKKEATLLAQTLGKEKLIAGALVTSGTGIYWWNKKLVSRRYWNISAFTRQKNTQRIISRVRKLHSDEVPIISFYRIHDANKDFLLWIRKNTK